MRHGISLLVLALADCGPDGRAPTEEGRRFAAAICAGVEDCGCVERFSSRQECEAEIAERFDDAFDAGTDVVVVDCFERVVAELETQPCADLVSLTPDGSCVALQGDKAAGAACERHFDLCHLA